MIDTIKLVSTEYNKTHKMKLALDKVISYGSNNKDFEYYSYRNFTIMLSDNKMTIQGSLTKFLVGHNINLKLGSLKDVRDSFEVMEKDLDVDIESFRVTRLDFGKCLLMPESVNNYFERLVALSRHKIFIYDRTGRQFINSIRSLIFYDKKYHSYNVSHKSSISNAKTIEILDIRDRNILRYEYRITDMPKHYKRIIHVSDLLDEEFYNDTIVRQFSTLFDKINVKKGFQIPDLNGRLPKEIGQIFEVYGILTYGEGEFVRLIEEAKRASTKDPSTYNRYKKRIKRRKKDHEATESIIDDLAIRISDSIHEAITFSKSNMLKGREFELYDYLETQIIKLQRMNKTVKSSKLKPFWHDSSIDYALKHDPSVLALQLKNKICDVERTTKMVNGFELLSGVDGFATAIDILREKKKVDDKGITRFPDLYDYLNSFATSLK